MAVKTWSGRGARGLNPGAQGSDLTLSGPLVAEDIQAIDDLVVGDDLFVGGDASITGDLTVDDITADVVVAADASITVVQAGSGNKATAGPLRLPNNGAATARNAGNSANIELIKADASDDILFGQRPYATVSAVKEILPLYREIGRAVNQCINGGFDVWQRGNGAFTTTNAYGPDRWQLSIGASSTMSVSRDSTNMDVGSAYCAAITYTHTNTSYLQQIAGNDHLALKGRTVSFSIRVKTSVANKIRATIQVSGGTRSYSAYHTGSGAYETLRVTATLSTDSTCNIGVSLEGTGTYYVDNAMLVDGSTAIDFVPTPAGPDLDACMRYMQWLCKRDATYNRVAFGMAQNTSGGFVMIRLPVQMGGIPSMTVSNVGGFSIYTPSTIVGASSLSLDASSSSSRDLNMNYACSSGPAAGSLILLYDAGGGTVPSAYVEWNP